MNSPEKYFKDLIHIRSVQYKPRERHKKLSNFEEFKNVYFDVISPPPSPSPKKIPNKPLSTVNQPRNFEPIKVVRLEMPPFGTEKAILVPPRKKKSQVRGILKKSKEQKSRVNNRGDMPLKVASTKQVVSELKSLEKQAKNETPTMGLMNATPSGLLENTNKEIDIAEEQLKKIKSLMKSKEVEGKGGKVARVSTPVHKRLRMSKHAECFNSKYLANLNALKLKLQTLEKKYFSKPQIVYRSVNDSFTQSSDIKILYENVQCEEDANIDLTLKSILNDLNGIIDPDSSSNDKVVNELRLSNISTQAIAEIPEVSTTCTNTSLPNFNTQQKSAPCPKYVSDPIMKPMEKLMNDMREVRAEMKESTSRLLNEIDYENERLSTPRNMSFLRSPNEMAGNEQRSGSYSTRYFKENLIKEDLNSDVQIEFCEDDALKHVYKRPNTHEQGTEPDDDTLEFIKTDMPDSVLSRHFTKYFKETFHQNESVQTPSRPEIGQNSMQCLLEDTKRQLESLKDLKSFETTGPLPYEEREIFNLTLDNNKDNNKDNNIPYYNLCNEDTFQRVLSPTIFEDDESESSDQISQVIDKSEARLKKFRAIKQDVKQVQEFCEQLQNITEDDVSYKNDRESFLKGNALEKSVLNSCYLTKEFEIHSSEKFYSRKSSNSKSSNTKSSSKSSSSLSADVSRPCAIHHRVDMDGLKKTLNNVLTDSIYSNVKF